MITFSQWPIYEYYNTYNETVDGIFHYHQIRKYVNHDIAGNFVQTDSGLVPDKIIIVEDNETEKKSVS